MIWTLYLFYLLLGRYNGVWISTTNCVSKWIKEHEQEILNLNFYQDDKRRSCLDEFSFFSFQERWILNIKGHVFPYLTCQDHESLCANKQVTKGFLITFSKKILIFPSFQDKFFIWDGFLLIYNKHVFVISMKRFFPDWIISGFLWRLQMLLKYFLHWWFCCSSTYKKFQ